jgi:predicted RNase H-like HicB family nuclease
MKTKNKKIILPIVIVREGKWFVVFCPVLNITTQGKTDKEAKENIKALIEEYLKDPDTLKPDFSKIIFPSLSYIETTIKT